MDLRKNAPIWQLDSVESTNDFLKEKSRHAELQEGSVVVAKFQTKGKGQRDRQWESEEGKNLLFSLFLCPTRKGNPYVINMMVSLAVCEVVRAIVPTRKTLIKWPNDILVEGHKLAGILIENVMSSGGKIKSFIGIGLNVNQSDFKEFNRPATSLALLCKHHFDLPTLAVQLQEAILRRYDQANWNLILEEYNATLYGQGAHQVFEDAAGNPKKTESIKVNSDGQMILKLMGGKEEVYDHGQLTYLI